MTDAKRLADILADCGGIKIVNRRNGGWVWLLDEYLRTIIAALRAQDGVVVPKKVKDMLSAMASVNDVDRMESDGRLKEFVLAMIVAAREATAMIAAAETTDNAEGQVTSDRGDQSEAGIQSGTGAGPVPPAPDELVKRLRVQVSHDDCEDCWYSCATLTCDDRRHSDKCDCGADERNALHAEAADRIEADQRRIAELEQELADNDGWENQRDYWKLRTEKAADRIESDQRRIAELEATVFVWKDAFTIERGRAEKAEAALKELREQRDREFRYYQSKIAERKATDTPGE